MPPLPTFHRPPFLGASPRLASVAIMLALALPLIAHAQTLYWDTNGGSAGSSDSATAPGTWDDVTAHWSTAVNGTGDTQVWTPGAHAIFSAGANASGTFTVNSTGTLSVTQLSFKEGNVTVSGGELSGAETVDVASGISATVGSVISGSQQFTKSGDGTLILTGANTYSGGTTVAGGSLQLGHGGASGSVVGNITNHGTLIFNRGDDHTFDGVVSGTGDFVHAGHILRFSSAHTYTGETRVNSGFLVLSTTVDNGLGSSAVVTVEAGASLDLSGRNQTFSKLEGSGTVYSFGSTNSALTLHVETGETHTFSGNLGGDYPNFGLIKTGDGTQILTGTNTVGNGIVVNGGTLQLGNGTHHATQQGGTGATGADGFVTDHSAYSEEERDGRAGGVGSDAFVGNHGATLDISPQTTIIGGTGGTGGEGAEVFSLIHSKQPGVGGMGGQGGNAIVVNGGTLSPLSSQSTVRGGTGGLGGYTGLSTGDFSQLPYLSSKGGTGGAAILFSTTAFWSNNGTLIGGTGGGAGEGRLPVSGMGGTAIILSQGGTLDNLGTITGGSGGAGVIDIDYRATGGHGGRGGTGVVFDDAGVVTNSGVITGGHGGKGFDRSISGGRGGDGGDGGDGVVFNAGGSLINSGTINAGLGGQGGTADFSGDVGHTGRAIVFSGGAGTLTNQSGGTINGAVVFANYANSATLETGSTLNGDLNLNTHTGTTLTLTGSGLATYSQAVIGVTTFAGSLVKTGSGTWSLDQAFTHSGGTIVSAGTLNLANISGSVLGTGSVTVESGAFLTGAGAFTGALTVDVGGTLAPGDSAGLMTIGSGSLFNGTVALEIGGLLRGLEYDAIDVGGDGELTFGGTLAISFIDGFTPASGDRFDLFKYTIATGTFDPPNLPTLTAGLSWDITDLYTLGSLSVVGSAIPEPSTYAMLLGLAMLGLAAWRKQSRFTN